MGENYPGHRLDHDLTYYLLLFLRLSDVRVRSLDPTSLAEALTILYADSKNAQHSIASPVLFHAPVLHLASSKHTRTSHHGGRPVSSVHTGLRDRG